jgi:hypothetical protein
MPKSKYDGRRKEDWKRDRTAKPAIIQGFRVYSKRNWRTGSSVDSKNKRERAYSVSRCYSELFASRVYSSLSLSLVKPHSKSTASMEYYGRRCAWSQTDRQNAWRERIAPIASRIRRITTDLGGGSVTATMMTIDAKATAKRKTTPIWSDRNDESDQIHRPVNRKAIFYR